MIWRRLLKRVNQSSNEEVDCLRGEELSIGRLLKMSRKEIGGLSISKHPPADVIMMCLNEIRRLRVKNKLLKKRCG